MENAEPSTRDALAALRSRVAGTRYPLETSKAAAARAARAELLGQLDLHVLPRLAEPAAPLLVVVGGSTGAGKSTLVNTLAGRPISKAGVLRPTTRSPVLVHHPDDAKWFTESRILPDLPRAADDNQPGDHQSDGEPAGEPAAGGPAVGGPAADDRSRDDVVLRLESDESLPAGIAVLDAPDVDSVAADNRALAGHLMVAADAWLFVTTAARYSDAAPWEFLAAAAARCLTVAVVLNRVAADAVSEVRSHLASMLAEQGLGDASLTVVEESKLDEAGMLPPDAAAPIRAWLDELGGDEPARAKTARRTLVGAIDHVLRRVADLADAADQQAEALTALRGDVTWAYETARRRVDFGIADGSVTRGEVLARWQDFVGAGDLARILRGRPRQAADLEQAIENGLTALVVEEANRAAERVRDKWRERPAGRTVVGDDSGFRASADLAGRVAKAVRQWQEAVAELVLSAGDSSPSDDKGAGLATGAGLVDGLALALMIVAFSGPDDGIAVVGRRVLESVAGVGDVAELASSARTDLSERLRALLDEEAAACAKQLDRQRVDPGAGDALRVAGVSVEEARERAG